MAARFRDGPESAPSIAASWVRATLRGCLHRRAIFTVSKVSASRGGSWSTSAGTQPAPPACTSTRIAAWSKSGRRSKGLDLERAHDEVAAAVPGPARLQRERGRGGGAQRPELRIADDRGVADPVGVYPA